MSHEIDLPRSIIISSDEDEEQLITESIISISSDEDDGGVPVPNIQVQNENRQSRSTSSIFRSGSRSLEHSSDSDCMSNQRHLAHSSLIKRPCKLRKKKKYLNSKQSQIDGSKPNWRSSLMKQKYADSDLLHVPSILLRKTRQSYDSENNLSTSDDDLPDLVPEDSVIPHEEMKASDLSITENPQFLADRHNNLGYFSNLDAKEEVSCKSQSLENNLSSAISFPSLSYVSSCPYESLLEFCELSEHSKTVTATREELSADVKVEKTPQDNCGQSYIGDSYVPSKVSKTSRRITCEQQAVSFSSEEKYSLIEPCLTSTKGQLKNQEDTVASGKFTNRRITNERQAYSSPIRGDHTLLSAHSLLFKSGIVIPMCQTKEDGTTCSTTLDFRNPCLALVDPFCSCQRSEPIPHLDKDNRQLSKEETEPFIEKVDNMHSLKQNTNLRAISPQEEKPKGFLGTLTLETHSTQAHELKNAADEKDVLKSDHLKRPGIPLLNSKGVEVCLSQTSKNLERNVVFGPYSSPFLPHQSMLEITKAFSSYHEELIELALLEDMEIACSCLIDFTSKYSPSKDIMHELLSWAKLNLEKMGQHQQDIFIYTIATVLQRFPDILPAPWENEIESFDREEKSNMLLCGVILKSFELNLYSKNFCDDQKLRQSKAYLNISWDKGRRNILYILRKFLSSSSVTVPVFSDIFCMKRNISHRSLSSLTSLQHLISLGLETSIMDMNNAARSMALEFYQAYTSLKDTSQKILLLSSIRKPMLTAIVTQNILERDFLNTKPLSEKHPTLDSVTDSFFGAVPKSKQADMGTKCEELAVLLYFAVWAVIECTRHRVWEPKRKRLLNPGLAQVKPLSKELQLKARSLSDHFKKLSPTQTDRTYYFLLLIECLFESVASS